MITVITVVHIITAIFLILVILLQAGKGAELGAVFGGGSGQAVFGPSGAAPLMGKLTTIAAIVFMATCLVLAYHSAKTRTIMPESETPNETEEAVPAAGPEETGQATEAEGEQTESTAAESEAAATAIETETESADEYLTEEPQGGETTESQGSESEAPSVDSSQGD